MIVGEWKYHKTTAVYQNLNKRNINTNTILSGKKIKHGLKRCKRIEKKKVLFGIYCIGTNFGTYDGIQPRKINNGKLVTVPLSKMGKIRRTTSSV